MIIRSTCIMVEKSCAHINHRFLVHRSRNIILQSIRTSIFNQKDKSDVKKVQLNQFEKIKSTFKLLKEESKYKVYYKSFKTGRLSLVSPYILI